jgi:hypothetical protein
MPGRAAPSLRRSAIEASGDFCGDDKGGEHVGRGRATRLSDWQDRRDDACYRLAGEIGQIEIHGMVGDAIRKSGHARRSSQRASDDAGAGRRSFKLDDVANNIGRRQLAAGQHHADGVYESGAGSLNDVWRRICEHKTSSESCNNVAQRLARVCRGWLNGGTGLLLGDRQGWQSQDARRAGAEENPPVDRVRVVIARHHEILHVIYGRPETLVRIL